MNLPRSLILLGVLLAVPASGAPGFRAEIGATYFHLQHGRFESGPPPAATDEDSRTAPYLALTYSFNESFGLRLGYHALIHGRATVDRITSPAGTSLPAIEVRGHYHDDTHVIGLAPEFSLKIAPRLTCTLAPQVNWVSSRGVISYSTTNPLILLLGPRRRTASGFTLGGGGRFEWSLNARAALSFGYTFLDLDPSFGRTAHAFSGGASWKF